MDLSSVKSKLASAIELLKNEIAKIRTGRASPALVETIVCPAYGGQQMLKIQELATITCPDPQTIVITPYDPSIIGDIKKGIIQANTGLTPILEAEVIRISLPALTAERREEYIKLLHVKLENARIMIRQIRQDILKEVDSKFTAKSISEDDKFRLHDEIQKEIDKTISHIDDIGKEKEAELRQI